MVGGKDARQVSCNRGGRAKEQTGQSLMLFCLFVHARVKALEMLGCLNQVTLSSGLPQWRRRV